MSKPNPVIKGPTMPPEYLKETNLKVNFNNKKNNNIL
jgi:hypothetical protein